jgi:hypothetical protein
MRRREREPETSSRRDNQSAIQAESRIRLQSKPMAAGGDPLAAVFLWAQGL